MKVFELIALLQQMPQDKVVEMAMNDEYQWTPESVWYEEGKDVVVLED